MGKLQLDIIDTFKLSTPKGITNLFIYHKPNQTINMAPVVLLFRTIQAKHIDYILHKNPQSFFAFCIGRFRLAGEHLPHHPAPNLPAKLTCDLPYFKKEFAILPKCTSRRTARSSLIYRHQCIPRATSSLWCAS